MTTDIRRALEAFDEIVGRMTEGPWEPDRRVVREDGADEEVLAECAYRQDAKGVAFLRTIATKLRDVVEAANSHRQQTLTLGENLDNALNALAAEIEKYK